MVFMIWMIFFINPFFSLIFIIQGMYRDRKNYIHYCIMLAGIFASFAYWFVPKGEMDLVRYFNQLDIYKYLNWNEFFNDILSNSTLFLQELLFYLISKTGNNHLLPAITIFITYFIIFYIVNDYCNRKKVSSKKMCISIIVILCILPFVSLVNNIRNILGISLFLLAIHREFIQHKRNIITKLLYIMPVFIHVSVLILLLLRIFLNVYEKRGKVFKISSCAVILLNILLVKLIAPTILNSFLGKISILNLMLNKALIYINGSGSVYATQLNDSIFSLLQKIFFISVVIFFMVLALKKIFNISKLNSMGLVCRDERMMLEYFLLVGFIVLGTSPIKLTVYFRFALIIIMLLYVVISDGEKIFRDKWAKWVLQIGILVFAVGGVLQQLLFMNKLTDISNMFSNVMIRSIFNMFIMR